MLLAAGPLWLSGLGSCYVGVGGKDYVRGLDMASEAQRTYTVVHSAHGERLNESPYYGRQRRSAGRRGRITDTTAGSYTRRISGDHASVAVVRAQRRIDREAYLATL